jgi:hypothetical protein
MPDKPDKKAARSPGQLLQLARTSERELQKTLANAKRLKTLSRDAKRKLKAAKKAAKQAAKAAKAARKGADEARRVYKKAFRRASKAREKAAKKTKEKRIVTPRPARDRLT